MIGSRIMIMLVITNREYSQLFTEVIARIKQDELFEIIKKTRFCSCNDQ